MSSDYANRHLNIAYLLFETDFQGSDPKCLCNIVAFDATLGNMEPQGVWQLLTKQWHHLRTELSFCDGECKWTFTSHPTPPHPMPHVESTSRSKCKWTLTSHPTPPHAPRRINFMKQVQVNVNIPPHPTPPHAPRNIKNSPTAQNSCFHQATDSAVGNYKRRLYMCMCIYIYIYLWLYMCKWYLYFFLS